MPWARAGDTSATYPAAMKVAGLPGADARSVNEVFGFFTRLSTQSAAHMTDYVVDAGTVAMIGGANTAQLVKLCLRAGLLARTRIDGALAYKLLDDPDFVHIRLKSEVEWERQQRADTLDLRITVPVRARDGDLCRYCRVPVQWRGRTSTRKGTLDHLQPGQPATFDTMVVACKGCNSELRDIAGDDRDLVLQPPPDPPFYTPRTAEWLTANGRPTAPTETPRPGNQPGNAADTSDPHTGGHRVPAQHHPSTSDKRPGGQPDTASTTATSDPACAGHRVAAPNARSPGIRHAFPVTDGMSSVGSGRDRSGSATSSPSAARRRSRRARRS